MPSPNFQIEEELDSSQDEPQSYYNEAEKLDQFRKEFEKDQYKNIKAEKNGAQLISEQNDETNNSESFKLVQKMDLMEQRIPGSFKYSS